MKKLKIIWFNGKQSQISFKRLAIISLILLALVMNIFILATPYYTVGSNQTNSTHNGSDIMHSLEWSNGVGLSGYIFSYCNETWDGSSCISNNTLCYQESANVSTACGGLSTGNYSVNASGNVPTLFNAVDGDFSTSTATNLGAQEINITINYTKPSNAESALWTVKDDGAKINLTIPNNCFNQNPLQLYVTSQDMVLDTWWYCWDGSTWNLLRKDTTWSEIHEEAIWWNLSTGGWINNSFVEMTGTFNQSNVTKSVTSINNSIVAWQVHANDTTNNWNESEVFYYTVFAPDVTPPEIFSAENITQTNTTVLFNASFSEPSNMSGTYGAFPSYTDGGTFANVSFGIVITANISGLTNGTKHGINITRACDIIGNCNTTGFTFTINTSQNPPVTTNYTISMCTDITTSGTYNLITNLTSTGTCININVSGVTLDCEGYSINYSTNANYSHGINILGNNTFIQGCTLLHNKHLTRNDNAINVIGTEIHNITVYNNTINLSLGNYSKAIWFKNVSNSNVSFNKIYTDNLDAYGVGLYRNSHNNVIHDNLIFTYDDYWDSNGIYFTYYNANNTIYNNNITTYSRSGSAILSWNSENGIFRNNILTTFGRNNYGIEIPNGSNNIIDNNYIDTHGDSSHGIKTIDSNSTNITGNIIKARHTLDYGIYTFDSFNNYIANNLFNYSGGIHINGKNNTIINNTMNISNYAVVIIGGENQITSYNNFVTGRGIFVSSQKENITLQFYNNTLTVTNDIYRALSTSETDFQLLDILFTNNSINAKTAFSVSLATANSTRVYNNIFNVTTFGATLPAKVNTTESIGGRIIGDGQAGGNAYINRSGGYSYYYSCTDANSDGICDSPFNLSSQSPCTDGVDCSEFTDYLPLSNKYSLVNIPYYTVGSNQTNSTHNGSDIIHSLEWNDDNELSSFIFSFCDGTWNGSDCIGGGWINDSSVEMTGTFNQSNVTKTVTSINNSNVSWQFHVNDTANQWNNSEIFYYTVIEFVDTTPPTFNSLETAGNPSQDSFGTDTSKRFYRNGTWQIEDWINITVNISDNIAVDTVFVMWQNETGWTNYSMVGVGDIYSINLSNQANYRYYTFNIWANDSSGNGVELYNWTFYDYEAGWGSAENYRKYVGLNGIPENISNRQFYLFAGTPIVFGQTQDRIFGHEQPTDGTFYDTGYLYSQKPLVSQERHCSIFGGSFIDDTIVINDTNISNMYVHVWWRSDDNVSNFQVVKERDNTYFPSEYFASYQTTVNESKLNISLAGFTYDDFYLETRYFEFTPESFDSNDINLFAVTVSGTGTTHPSMISYIAPSVEYISFYIFNLPDNATLKALDTDSDGLSNFDELFIYWTDPKVSDTDGDGLDDNDDCSPIDPTDNSSCLYLNFTNIQSTPSSSTATITWTTNKLSNSTVYYSTNSTNLNLISTSASLVTSHSVPLSGLSPSLLYYYNVSSSDSAGNTNISETYNFTTTATPSTPPSGSSGSSSSISIPINDTIDPEETPEEPEGIIETIVDTFENITESAKGSIDAIGKIITNPENKNKVWGFTAGVIVLAIVFITSLVMASRGKQK